VYRPNFADSEESENSPSDDQGDESEESDSSRRTRLEQAYLLQQQRFLSTALPSYASTSSTTGAVPEKEKKSVWDLGMDDLEDEEEEESEESEIEPEEEEEDERPRKRGKFLRKVLHFLLLLTT